LIRTFWAFFGRVRILNPRRASTKGNQGHRGLNKKQFDNLVFDYQAFKIKYQFVVLSENFEIKSFKMPSGKVIKSAGALVREGFVVLEKGLEIELPKQLVGKAIKQVEVIPKYRSFHAVFVYDDDISEIYQIVEPFKTTEIVELDKLDSKCEFRSKIVTLHNQVMSIDLGLNNLATCVTNGVIEPFIIDGRRGDKGLILPSPQC
jgi:putative transposase